MVEQVDIYGRLKTLEEQELVGKWIFNTGPQRVLEFEELTRRLTEAGEYVKPLVSAIDQIDQIVELPYHATEHSYSRTERLSNGSWGEVDRATSIQLIVATAARAVRLAAQPSRGCRGRACRAEAQLGVGAVSQSGPGGDVAADDQLARLRGISRAGQLRRRSLQRAQGKNERDIGLPGHASRDASGRSSRRRMAEWRGCESSRSAWCSERAILPA